MSGLRLIGRGTVLGVWLISHLLEDLVDVDLVGLDDLVLATLLLASISGLGDLLGGLLLCLGSHVVIGWLIELEEAEHWGVWR